jgi:hypothetical protein
MIKVRRMKWTGHVACMGEMRGADRFWWGNLVARDHMEDPGTDWSIILKWIVKKWDEETWTGLLWLRIGTGGGLL